MVVPNHKDIEVGSDKERNHKDIRVGSDKKRMSKRESLLKWSMKGDWDKVVKMYKDNAWVHEVKITGSGNTALHIAVADGKEDIVEQLVNLICNNDAAVLITENEQRNTILHLAALTGSVRMCVCIAVANSTLVGVRNLDGETPLFLAALHGKKEAFLSLHKCDPDRRLSYCRRKDGETILHCAITGDYFELAYIIIQHYGDLVYSVNEKGITPLHLLATKPSVFRSGSRLSWWNKIIYHCVLVNELKLEDLRNTSEDRKYNFRGNGECPESYHTCYNFFRKLLNMIRGGQSTNELRHRRYPSNCDACFGFIKVVFKAMQLVIHIFAIGLAEISKLKSKKEKHIWSVQIINELVRRTSMYRYEDDGKNPQLAQTSTLQDESTTPYTAICSELTNPDDQKKKKNGKDKIEEEMSGSAFGECVYQATSSGPRARLLNDKNMEQKILNLGIVTEDKKSPDTTKETTILIAAKHGVTEIVEKILKVFPQAIEDMNSEKKNIVLLAVENRQSRVYQLLRKKSFFKESVFRKMDNKGNSALHLAAVKREFRHWLVPGAALQMQREIKWYKFIKNSMHPSFFTSHNHDGQTAEEIFTKTHKNLVSLGSQWLNTTSQSCCLVATIIAPAAFSTSATISSNATDSYAKLSLEDKLAFKFFSGSSLIALCSSLISLIIFLSIMNDRHREKDFKSRLPIKFLVALSSLLLSIISTLISFCSTHFLAVKDSVEFNIFPVYVFLCVVVTLIVVFLFPLYFEFLKSNFLSAEAYFRA